MRTNSKTINEISLPKRLVAVVMLVSYVSVISPFTAFANGKEKAKSTNSIDNIIEEKAEVLISAKNGGTVVLGEASIEIPEGALKKDTKISITRLRKVEDTGESLYNAIPKSGGYRFLPAGTKFEKDVTITLPYSSELNSKPQALEELYTYFYDTKKTCWVKLERLDVDKEKCQVKSLSTHFTDMINATLTLPESASPVDVNLNSIKNLEAAKPDSHLIKFNPPQATNMGDASFSFELGIPSGRKGMQPQISVSYSSAGGNGIMGKGFDINYGSSITTDTRFGLPNYDTHDTYMLDGIVLYETSRNDKTFRYKPKKETSFSKIVRYNSGTENDYWEVTDKSGTKRIYAQNKSSCVGSGRQTFTWNLTKTVDVHQNSIEYSYIKDENEKYVYPAAIYYTGVKDTHGNYSVVFHYNEYVNNGIKTSVNREDIRIDARSKSLVTCSKLLTYITTHYTTCEKPIRKYTFTYKDGLAKEKMLTSLTVSNNADEQYAYTFDYTEPETDKDGNTIYFSEAEEWNNGKPLQIGKGSNMGANFTVSGGVGYGTDFIDGHISGGGSGSVSEGESYTEDTLIDINGDGQPDSIRQDKNGIWVALNTQNGFLNPEKVQIKKGSLDYDLDYEKNKSSSVGWNVYAGVGAVSVPLSLGVGYAEVKQEYTSNTLCSFMDMDRDGLVDIVETNKSTYLKNMGNLVFEERNLFSKVSVSEVTKTLDPNLAEQYRKTYFVQTPFRMWKSPYDGIISISETANGISGNFDDKKTVIAKTYIGDNETDDVDLRISVNSTNQAKKAKKNVDINKGTNYYFISDNSIEPENTDINWKINIKYSDIKSFKTDLKHPFINLSRYINTKPTSVTYSVSEDDALEEYKKYLIKNYLDNQEELVKLFVFFVTEVSGSNNDSTDYQVSCYYDYKWPEKTSENEQKKILTKLKENKYLIPTVFTETQFNEYFNSIKNNSSNQENIEDYYSNFALQFEHIITENIYVLRDFSEKNTLVDFLEKYPIPETVQTAALFNYNKNNIEATFSLDNTFYELSATEEFDGKRALEKSGTASENIINIGKYNSSDLYLDLKSNKPKYKTLKDGVEVFNSLDELFNFIDVSKTEDSISVRYGINKDSKENYESFYTVTLDGLSYRALNLSGAEFQKIIDDINVDFSNAHDSHWQLIDTDVEKNRVKTSEVDVLFKDISMTSEQKENLLAALYDTKDSFRKVQITFDENPQFKEEYEYSYYVLKNIPEYETAQRILDEYKKEVILNKEYPFYTEAEKNSYILKDYWKIFKEKEVAREEWEEKIEAKISKEDPELKEKDPEKYTEKINEEFEKEYQEYLTLNTLFLAECSKFNFGKYSKIETVQEFNIEHLNSLKNNSYSILISDDTLNLQKTVFTIAKTEWDSSNDFVIDNKNIENILYAYQKDIEKDNVKDIKTVNIIVENDEFLYGGYNNWFYGIWKGAISDVAFSKRKLDEFNNASDNINSEEDFKSKENSVPSELSDNDKQDPSEKTTIHFYLPQKQTETDVAEELSKSKNAAVNYEVDLSKSLLGTVAMNSEVKKTSEGRMTVTDYYMPFLSDTIIHADRAGGKAYYNIEGINNPVPTVTQQFTNASPMYIPTIRKSYTKSTDKTPTAKFGIGAVGVDFSKTTNSASAKESYNTAISIPGASSSFGTNEATSTSSQIIQDMNMDGIPDIVQIDNKNLRIIKGTKLNENGELCYNDYSELLNIEYLSKNETTTNVYGGSISPQGAVKSKPKTTASGNIKSVCVEVQPSASASGGITYSTGTSLQTHGIGDINSDGLPDYYNGTYYSLNNGSEFTSANTNFSIGELSKSENKSIGLNFSVGIGASGSANLSNSSSLTTGVNGTVGITYNSTSSNTHKMLLDINGDGLQDVLEKESDNSPISVYYNTGNGFSKGPDIQLPDWNNYVENNVEKFITKTDSEGFEVGLIENIPVIGYAAKKGLTSIAINPFGANAKNFSNYLDWNTSVTLGLSGSLGVNVDIGIKLFVPVYVGTINITISGGAGANASTSINGASVKMLDLDGDGLPDHVLRIPGVATYWKRNISGRYGQLVQVNMPQGGNVQIAYDEVYGTTDNPNFKYVMSSVTTNDGTDGNGPLPKLEHGEHSVTTTYTYEKGYYDRQKKDFYGFETVITKFEDNTYKKDEYHNREYYLKGCLKQSVTYSSDNKKLSESTTEYVGEKHTGYLIALPEVEESWNYELSSAESAAIHTTTTYEYDLMYGNCEKVVQDFGDGTKLVGEIEYQNLDSSYIIGLPILICVYDGEGYNRTLLRKRRGTYDSFGQLVELKQYFDKDHYSRNTLTYDSYGNIKSVTDSRNAKLSYDYDDVEHMFVVTIIQSGNKTDEYKSYLDYDFVTQTKSYEIDCNDNKLTYEYDKWQRLSKIFTSYDSEIPAVSYSYFAPEKDSSGKRNLWYTVTSNKVTFDSKDSSIIKTILQVDGLGRAVRTAKTGVVEGVLGWNASGAVEYDSKGRTIKEGMTEFIKGSPDDIEYFINNSEPKMTDLFTSYFYDEKDRKVVTILPDKSLQLSKFELANSHQLSYTTDIFKTENDYSDSSLEEIMQLFNQQNVSLQETDSRGNIVRVAKYDSNSNLLTEVTYIYNEMGEMLTAFDAKGHPISAEYDLLGRRTALESLDSGRQEFEYDECSNLIRETNSVLKENNKLIVYTYDGLNRLEKIEYPYTSTPTVYTYGSQDDKDVGAAGKILCVTDDSGTLSYEYGKLGEVIKETRTLATHLNGSKSNVESVMQYCSDYLGRMQWITYPDGEKITYGYDAGGQVNSVTGEHYGIIFNYVNDIHYDEYGQRTYIEYGNGVTTEYSYDSARRWLNSINTQSAWNKTYQNIKYDFDVLGNVKSYENDCLDSVNGDYKTRQEYSYDNLYQLIRVEGNTTSNLYSSAVAEYTSNYVQEFTFDNEGLGNLMSKVSTETVSPFKSIGDNLNYNFNYVYDEKYAHRLVSAGDRYYKYDANGNIICEQEGAFEGDEADSYHKITQESQNVYSTDYGWGLFKDDSEKSSSAAQKYKRTYTWNERNQLISSVDANYSTAYVYGQDGQRSNKYTSSSETLYFNKMWTLHTDSGNAVDGGQYAKNIYLGDTRIVTKLSGGKQNDAREESVKQYYYHSDHLGSASLITDYEGNEYERLEYTPYGEIWVDKKSPENTGLEYLPYKFTGKEMDEETGLYYYGARYLDPKYSMWISTDPALGDYIPKAPIDEEAKKYNQNLPGMGGVFNHINSNLYHYAGNNPVKYTDPDGRKLELTVDKSTQTMTVKMSVKVGNVTFLANETVNVTTHVVADSDATQPNKKANENLNPKKQNKNGSAWTQFPNGEWKINGSKDGPNQNVDGIVDEQLTTNAHQLLKKRDADGNVITKNGKDVSVDDWGYNIHYTENSNTAGCIGVKSKAAMKFIMFLYKFNERFDPNSSTIKVTGTEE